MALKGFLSSVYTIVFGDGHEDSPAAACHFKPPPSLKQREFQMPVHYPRYKKGDYEKMEEWKLDLLLEEYGLCFDGSLHQKRDFAIGAFIWPDQIADN